MYDDGVNVAARVQELADAGGICLSGSAYEQVKGKLLGVIYLEFCPDRPRALVGQSFASVPMSSSASYATTYRDSRIRVTANFLRE